MNKKELELLYNVLEAARWDAVKADGALSIAQAKSILVQELNKLNAPEPPKKEPKKSK